jgi:hypothetical protein
MDTGRERYVTRDPREVFRTWWPLWALGALQFGILAPVILGISWWCAPWLFVASLALAYVQTRRRWALAYGPIVTLDDSGITAEQGLFQGQVTLPRSEYAGYRDELPNAENMPFWAVNRFSNMDTRVLTLLSRRHGVYTRLWVRFPLGASQEQYRRLLEALDRRAPREMG